MVRNNADGAGDDGFEDVPQRGSFGIWMKTSLGLLVRVLE